MDKTNYNLFIHWIFCSLKVIYEFKQCDRKLYFHSFNIKNNNFKLCITKIYIKEYHYLFRYTILWFKIIRFLYIQI